MSEIPTNIVIPDFEKVIGALLRPLVVHDNDIGNFLVLDYDEQIGNHDTPFITIRERGGEFDMDDFTSYPNIEVSSWGKTRSVARNTNAQVQLLILQVAGEEVDGVLIDSAEDVTGSEEPSGLENPDDRCVTRMFRLGFRPQYQD